MSLYALFFYSINANNMIYFVGLLLFANCWLLYLVMTGQACKKWDNLAVVVLVIFIVFLTVAFSGILTGRIL